MKFKTTTNKKTIAAISYITILGWIVSYILYNNGGRSPLAKYHLKQSFGMGVLGAILGVGSIIITTYASLYFFLAIHSGIFIFLTLGITNAINLKKKPIPVIGSIFIDRFYFI